MVGRCADRACQFLKNDLIMDRNRYPPELCSFSIYKHTFLDFQAFNPNWHEAGLI